MQHYQDTLTINPCELSIDQGYHATPHPRLFLCAAPCIYVCIGKNLTIAQPHIYVGMPNVKKQEYYRKNRKKRLEYQHEYYNQNKEKIKGKREQKMIDDPDIREKERGYNKSYYTENKQRIMERRKLNNRK